MALTSFEAGRLRALAKKAGMKIDLPANEPSKLSRLEIRKIQEALRGGAPVVIVRKAERVRIFHVESYLKMQKLGKRVGQMPYREKMKRVGIVA